MYKKLATKTLRKGVKSKNEGSIPGPNYVAVWLDRNEAYVFCVKNENIDETIISSGLPGKHKATGGTHANIPYAEFSVSSEKNEQSWREEILKKYFGKIKNFIKNADHILIMGPGTAKSEFQKELQKEKDFQEKLNPMPIAIERMDKSSLKTFVKTYFLGPPKRKLPTENVG